MSKPFDATLKKLADQFGDAWGIFLCQRLGLPPQTKAEPLDADLSTASPQADKLFRLSGPVSGCIHLELQATWAGDLPAKVLLYNVLAEERYGGPVRSVIVLLRPEAHSPEVTGALTRKDEAGEYLKFRYHVVRLWAMPCGPILQGPLGTVPLALLTDDAQPQLPHLIQLVHERLKQEGVADQTAGAIWTAAQILLGLRYDKRDVYRLFQGVAGMEESSVYQDILAKGMAKGMAEGMAEGMARGILEERHAVLLRLGPDRLGKPTKKVVTTIRSIHDPDRLERMRDRLLKAKNWNDLLRTP